MPIPAPTTAPIPANKKPVPVEKLDPATDAFSKTDSSTLK